jgi:Porin subfamily
MQKIIITTIVGALPTCVAAAELPKKTPPPPREVKTNPCAAYGAGFVKVEGSTTCVKIGGNVSVEAGRSR